MKRTRLALLVSLSLVVASCGDRREQVLAPRLLLNETSAPQEPACVPASETDIHALIDQLFSDGNEGQAANARFDNIAKLLAMGADADIQTAKEHTLSLVDFTVRKYKQGTLLDPPGDLTTEHAVFQLANELLCFAGLPLLPDGFLDPNSAFALITPTSDSTVRTGNEDAGADFNVGDVSQPVLVTITPITPDSDGLYGGAPGPLNTLLDQYPLFFKFTMSPVLPEFSQPVEVAVCVPDPEGLLDPTTFGRLRLAHNGAQDDSLEILEPLAPDGVAGIVACGEATQSARRDGVFRLFDLASAVVRPVVRTLLPQELMASPMFATGGVGGTTKTFSPFGVVDPLVMISPTTTPPESYPIGGTVPASNTPTVVLSTRQGTPFPNLDVTFAASNGSVEGVAQVTHQTSESGVAAVTSWTLGLTAGPSTVTVTVAPPHVGSYIEPNPLTFTTQAVPATQLGFHVVPSDAKAGETIAPPVEVEGRDHLGRWVPGFRGNVTVQPVPGVTPFGTATSAATAENSGRAVFVGLRIERAGTYHLLATAAPDLAGTSSAFTISAADAFAISKVEGDSQSVLVTGAYATVPTAPKVLVVDQYENPVPNASVTFTVVNGGYVGELNSTQYTTTTGSDGKATASGWMITVGTNQLDAQITGNATAWVRFTATGTTTLTNLTSQCIPSQGTGDDLSRGFYFPNSGQNRIRRLGTVTLYMSSNDPASTATGTQYTVVLTARSGSFAGTPIGTATATPFFRGTSSQNTPVNFAFPASVSEIASGPVFFSLTATPVAGGRGGVTFNTGPCGLGDARCKTECPVVETSNATWAGGTPLSAIFRRKGCGIQIMGMR